MSYANRTLSLDINRFVTWVTDEPDVEGVSYPGPGNFGDDTDGFTVTQLPGGGGGGGASQTPYIVGFSVQGDTLADCNYLDSGNGAAFAQACEDASGPDGGLVLVRRGDIDFNLDGAPTTIEASSCVIRGISNLGSGVAMMLRAQGEVTHISLNNCVLEGFQFIAPVPDGPITTGDFIAAYVFMSGGAISDCTFYGSGSDYTEELAGVQGARAFLAASNMISVRRLGFFDMPPTGRLLADYAQSFEAMHVYNGGF